MNTEFAKLTYKELNNASKRYRNRALNYLSSAAREINNCAIYNNSVSDGENYNVNFFVNSFNTVFRCVSNAHLQFSCYKEMELAKKLRRKMCKKFTNKRYKKHEVE